MSRWNMLRCLACALSLSVAGCVVDGTEATDRGASEEDVDVEGGARAPAPGPWSSRGIAPPAVVQGDALEVRPACAACGPGVPWTPPPPLESPSAQKLPP